MNGPAIGVEVMFRPRTFVWSPVGLPLLLALGILFPAFLLFYLILVCGRLIPTGGFYRTAPGLPRWSSRAAVWSGPRSPPL